MISLLQTIGNDSKVNIPKVFSQHVNATSLLKRCHILRQNYYINVRRHNVPQRLINYWGHVTRKPVFVNQSA